MNNLYEQFTNLSIDSLTHDVNIMIQCYEMDLSYLILDNMKIESNSYESIQVLYQNILCIITKKNLQNDLLEIMPYIDEYLEYYSKIS